MASMLDSTAVFSSRLRDLGLSQYSQSLEKNGVDTLGRLAFITTYQPGLASTDEPFVKSMLKALDLQSEGDLSSGDLSQFRRLWIEASTVAISEMRNRSERTEEQAVKKIPIPERSSRRAAQQSRLVGIKIQGVNEPSHALLDFCQSIRDDNELHMVELSKCTCRDQELDGVKKEKFFKPDQQGNMKEHSADPERFADLSTEIKVRSAMLRRTLAMDQAGLVDFAEFEAYHDFLFELLSQEVPETHNRVTMDQVLKADRAVWKRMALYTRDGVLPVTSAAPNPSTQYPIMIALDKARSDPVVTAALQPLAKPTRSGPYDRSPYEGSPTKSAKGKGKMGGKSYGKGGKSSKGGKGSDGPSNIPVELAGLRKTTSKGHRYCFKFNLSCGCTFSKAGDHCRLGFHGCMRCGMSDHGADQCPKKPP